MTKPIKPLNIKVQKEGNKNKNALTFNTMDASLAGNMGLDEQVSEKDNFDYNECLQHLKLIEAGCMDTEAKKILEPLYADLAIIYHELIAELFKYTEDEAHATGLSEKDIADARNGILNDDSLSWLISEVEEMLD